MVLLLHNMAKSMSTPDQEAPSTQFFFDDAALCKRSLYRNYEAQNRSSKTTWLGTNKVYEDMVCQIWSGRTQAICTQPWLQPHSTPLGRTGVRHQCPISLKLVGLNGHKFPPLLYILRFRGKLSQKNEGCYGSKGVGLTPSTGLDWDVQQAAS